MAARDKIIVSNENAKNVGVSYGLLWMIREGDVTHPNIARRIGSYFGLTEDETEELMPEIHRPSSPEYEPDRFVSPVDRALRLNGERIPMDPYSSYIREKNKRDLA